MKVKIIKQWRGHDPGTEPELTDERATELIRNGYARPIPALVKPVVEEAVVEEDTAEPEVPQHPRPRKRRVV